jgi:hypothetical protein
VRSTSCALRQGPFSLTLLCRQTYIEFYTQKEASGAKRLIDKMPGDGGHLGQKKITTQYWNPTMNPFRTLPKDAPTRGKDAVRPAPTGPYNDRGNFNERNSYNERGNYGGGFRGRGGFSGGRGNMGQNNFNRNYGNNNMGYNNMGGGGGFGNQNGNTGGNFGFGARGGMMGGGMRGNPGGMRGGRGGMMGMNPMGGMPMGMPGNMGMGMMGNGMQGKGPTFFYSQILSRRGCYDGGSCRLYAWTLSTRFTRPAGLVELGSPHPLDPGLIVHPSWQAPTN